GGATSAVINEGVSRSPVFVFDRLLDAGKFVLWVSEQVDALRREAESTTSHGKMLDVGITMESNHVYLLLEFFTGDAAGQNMVTLAADAVCRYIEANSPTKPKAWFVEGNMSGDKKASALALQTVRGKKVIAEVVMPAKLIERKLRTTAKRM